MGFATKMDPNVFQGIFAEHESEFKNFPWRQVFEKKKAETSKNSVFNDFWKTVELNKDGLEPSEIDNLYLLFKPWSSK